MSNAFNLKCPLCGEEGGVRIAALVWIDMTEDGSDASNSDHEFDPTSGAYCQVCYFGGTVADFEQGEADPVPTESVRRLGPLVADVPTDVLHHMAKDKTQVPGLADKLVAALREAVRALNVHPRFRVQETDSYAIASLCDKAIDRYDREQGGTA